jgi:AraC-like DNA-binding protein
VFQQIARFCFRNYNGLVIVTAAVHRGFSSSLSALPLTFRHWAGVSPYT